MVGIYNQPAKHAVDSIYKVDNVFKGGHGTGWCYKKDHMITNAHVTAGFPYVEIEGSRYPVVADEPKYDLAIINTSLCTGDNSLSLARSMPRWGSELTTVGYPGSNDKMAKIGTMGGFKWIQMTVLEMPSIYQGLGFCDRLGLHEVKTFCIAQYWSFEIGMVTTGGQSGSPVLDWSGQVVGIINLASTNSLMGIGIPLVKIREFLKTFESKSQSGI
jgi:hypothetical protein